MFLNRVSFSTRQFCLHRTKHISTNTDKFEGGACKCKPIIYIIFYLKFRNYSYIIEFASSVYKEINNKDCKMHLTIIEVESDDNKNFFAILLSSMRARKKIGKSASGPKPSSYTQHITMRYNVSHFLCIIYTAQLFMCLSGFETF
jgi:hypothetical protein